MAASDIAMAGAAATSTAMCGGRVVSMTPRLVTVRLRKDGSVTDEKPYDPENVTRPKEQRANGGPPAGSVRRTTGTASD
jgi:hypothetical protein